MESGRIKKGKSKTIESFFKPNEATSSSSKQPPPSSSDQNISKRQRVEGDVNSLERDPGLRIPICEYPINERDEIRRAYIDLKPYQPTTLDYPRTQFGDQYRRFQLSWFDKFPWLEYSIPKDAAYCFPCFLFENKNPRYPAFTTEGFRSWKRVNCKKQCPFLVHVGGLNSPHNNNVKAVEDLENVTRHIDKVMSTQTLDDVQKNRLRLTTSIEVSRWLSLQGCAFIGHDESKDSKNKGNFLEMLELFRRTNDGLKGVILEDAPQNAKYTSHMIQRELLHILANKVRRKIREEVGDAKFCILVDEAKDVSNKEQMAIILRFVDREGFVRERFFDIVHVSDTAAATLKKEISDALARYKLHICNMRGQGYDGASNMRGAWNGLQALFLRDCPYAYYVHCFAHRLQLALVGAAEKEVSVWSFFSQLNIIVNIFSASPKRQAELHEAQVVEIKHMIATGERVRGRAANQIGTLQRAGKTRWSSHFESICSVVDLFSSLMTVLGKIMTGDYPNDIKGGARGALIGMRSFDFVFILRLMHKIMGVTDLLCRALQEKSLDILSAMNLVSTTKYLLQELREKGYEYLYEDVVKVCSKYDITISDMDSQYKCSTGRSCQQKDLITVDHHYRFDIFNAVIDFQVEEINSRFNDESVKLLKLSASLEPRDGFKSFDIDSVCTLAEEFYPNDFCEQEMHHLRSQLNYYRRDVLPDERFQKISTIAELCQRLFKTNKSSIFHLIDRLLRLVLTLPVTTATTERAFSAMKIVKSVLRNKMEEEFLADNLVLYIEREFSASLDVDSVIDEFYSLKDRKAKLR